MGVAPRRARRNGTFRRPNAHIFLASLGCTLSKNRSHCGIALKQAVLPGLVPGIHVLRATSKAWMAGTSPAMTSWVI
jgi:hypothetical protein